MELRHLVEIGLVLQQENNKAAEDETANGVEAVDKTLVQQPAVSFEAWLFGLLVAGVTGRRFLATSERVAKVICHWRSNFPGKLWARLSRDSCATLIKEAREAIPVIAFVQQRVEALDVEHGPVTILDLCSGLGFLGMLLVEILPSQRVHACVLMDQAWPLKGRVEADAADENLPSRRNRTRLNWDHIYDLPWPSTLTTRRSDLKLPSTHAQILSRILEPSPGPVFVLGIHLCGILSIRAIETFNRGPKCVGLVLKPCCLPSMDYVKQQTRWTLGAHSFAAAEVCMWGKYNKNQWQGPVKATLGVRFRAWADNLHRGIVADSKRTDRVPLVEDHYQDAYLFAERAFSSTAPVPNESEPMQLLVRQVLDASTPWEVLGVPEDISMRGLHRRFAALSKSLGKLEEEPDAVAAFKRVKQARDAIRGMRDPDMCSVCT